MPPPAADPGYERIQLELHGPIELELAAKVPRERAAPLGQVISRLLVWWGIDAREIRAGDGLTVVYAQPAGEEPKILAIRYRAQQQGKTLTAYAFQPVGAPFARYYQADGEELEERLKDSPVADYEQITSLLRDGRHHKGVDFKCPVGTPVALPFDGTLVRKNWKWRANGNCLELTDAHTGRHAIFLHLSPLPADLEPGQRFKRGQVIARSGNTGHTTAPHLHYQLEDAHKKVLDPFAVQPTYRARLGANQEAAFQETRRHLDAALGP